MGRRRTFNFFFIAVLVGHRERRAGESEGDGVKSFEPAPTALVLY